MNVIFIDDELIDFARVNTSRTKVADLDSDFLRYSNLQHYSYNGFPNNFNRGNEEEYGVFLNGQYGYCYRSHTLLYRRINDRLYFVNPVIESESHPAHNIYQCLKAKKTLVTMEDVVNKDLCKHATVQCESPADIERVGRLLMQDDLSTNQIIFT